MKKFFESNVVRTLIILGMIFLTIYFGCTAKSISENLLLAIICICLIIINLKNVYPFDVE